VGAPVRGLCPGGTCVWEAFVLPSGEKRESLRQSANDMPPERNANGTNSCQRKILSVLHLDPIDPDINDNSDSDLTQQ